MSPSAGTYYQLRVPDHVRDTIRGMHPELIRKIRSALKLILEDPSAGKPLREKLSGLSGFRVGRIRIIYRPATDRIIEIIAIGPRRSIYRETYRLLRKINQ